MVRGGDYHKEVTSKRRKYYGRTRARAQVGNVRLPREYTRTPLVIDRRVRIGPLGQGCREGKTIFKVLLIGERS